MSVSDSETLAAHKGRIPASYAGDLGSIPSQSNERNCSLTDNYMSREVDYSVIVSSQI